MRAEGLYTGGPVRYGYRAVEKGRLNKKNKPVKDLEIDPEEAAIVKEIFERTVYKGAGPFVMANELNERGIRTHHGAKFNALKVNRILAERQYTGYLITKDVTSTFLPELQIITQELFRRSAGDCGDSESEKTPTGEIFHAKTAREPCLGETCIVLPAAAG